MTEDCLFCGIAEGTVDADRVEETERWVAFRDINPQAPTHILIIPRQHVSGLQELEEAHRGLAGELLLAARRLAESEGLAEDGYRVVANAGRGAGQTVFHLHLHLLGGRRMSWPPG